jgi:Flp pilus assembly protein TadD
MTTRLLSRGYSAWQMALEPHRLEGERLRWLGWTALLSTAACLVNPYFLRGALFPFSLFSETRSSHAFSSWIDEFRSPFVFAGLNSFFASYMVVTAVAVAGFVFNRRRLSLSLAALLVAFFYLSTQAQRNVALFGLVAGLSVICNWGRPERAARHKRAARALPTAATLMRAAVALYASVMVLAAASDAYYRRTDTAKRFGFGVSPHRFPIRALAFVRAEKLPLPVISGLGDGGYVLFEGGPRSVFIDGRLEVYGPEAIGQALRFLQTGTGLDDWVRRTEIGTIVLRHEQEVGLLQTLERDPEWRAVYFDPIHVVYLRSTASTREQIARLAIDWRAPRRTVVAVPAELNPKDWLAGWWPKVADHREALALGNLFLQVGNLPLARSELELALRQAPDHPDTCLHLGLLYAAQGQARRSRALLERVDPELLQRPEILTLGGFIQEQVGDSAAALTSYRRAVQAGGRARFDYVNLARVALATQRWKEAYWSLQQLAGMSDSSPVDWNNLGVLAARMGRHQQAVADFRQSLRLDPNQPSVYNQMGASYGALGSLDQARQAFRQALALDPKYQLARANLERLSSMR